MNIQIVRDVISEGDLREIAKEFYNSMIKGAIDLEKGIVAFGGEYHIDAANILVENRSEMDAIWGFNILLDQPRDSWIEYTALINIKPEIGNRGMLIDDAHIRDKIKNILEKKIA